MTTTTASTSSTTLGQSILTSLNATSGVDTASLVASLVQAQFAAKNAALTAQDTALTAQISSVAKVQSAITGFSSALTTLVKSGSLAIQPTVSDSTVLSASALPGASLSGLSASVEVSQLATAQTATINKVFANKTDAISAGTLTLQFGTIDPSTSPSFTASGSSTPITIDSAHSSLSGIAQAINGSNTGLTANVVTNADGSAQLAITGPTGAAKAFTLTGSAGLTDFNVGAGSTASSTVTTAAANAKLSLNGIAVERASNTISDLVDGVKLNLAATNVGKPVKLGSTTPTDALSQAVTNFVDSYNQTLAAIKAETDPAAGPLKSDYNATSLQRALSQLTLTDLVTNGAPGAPTNLAAIGVSTNKDGTLSVDSTQLSKAIATSPDGVAALFADGTGATGGGLAAALGAISTAATDNKTIINGKIEGTGLAASTALYTARKAKVTDAETQVTTDTAAYQERLTKQYAASDARVAAYKATQAQLQNQIDQWNKSGQ